MLRRLLIGLLKGILVGGAVGAGLHFGLGLTTLTGALAYVLYGVVALLAGIVAGQAPWKPGAWVASILKGIVGFGIGAGLYALASRFLNIPVSGLADIPASTILANAPLLFAPVVATVYATLVELDDGGDQPQEEKTGVRVKADAEELADEEPAAESKKASASAKARR